MQDLAVREFKVIHDMNDKQKRGSYARYAGGSRVYYKGVMQDTNWSWK